VPRTVADGTFKLTFSDKLKLFLDGGKLWDSILKDAAQQVGQVLNQDLVESFEAKRATEPTGATRRGATFSVQKSPTGYVVRVGWLAGASGVPNPSYIRQLNYGGPIPKHGGPMPKGKFLVFEINGKTVFAKKVNQKGLHFIEPVEQSAPARAAEELDRGIQRGIERLR